MTELEVEAFPLDLPHDIKIDISGLEQIGQAIHVSDINLGDKIALMDDLEDTILSTIEFEEEEVEEVPVVAEGAVEGAE